MEANTLVMVLLAVMLVVVAVVAFLLGMIEGYDTGCRETEAAHIAQRQRLNERHSRREKSRPSSREYYPRAHS